MTHTISSGVHWAVPTSPPISRPKLYCWLFYSRKRGLHDLAILTLGTWCLPHTHTDRGPRPSSCSYREDGAPLCYTYMFFLEVKPCPTERGVEKSPHPYYLLRPHKTTTFWALGANPGRPGPYVYVSMGQASPTPHPSFSAKAPRLRELEVVDSHSTFANLIFSQGIVFGLV